MEITAPEKKRYSLPIRIVAGVLAGALAFGLAANGFTRVKIRKGDSSEAATNYLAASTGYVSDGTQDRLQEKLLTLAAPTTLEDHYRIAGVQIAEEKYQQALESIQICIGMDPATDPALTQDLLMKEGCLMVLLEQYDQALQVLTRVSEMSPDYGEVYLVMAQIHSVRARQEELARSLERYLALIPGDHQIRIVLAQTYFSMEEFALAQEHYQLVLRSREALDDPAQIHYLCALTQIQLGQFASAEENLLAASADSPELEGIFYYLGICQMARSGYQEAVENLTKSIESGSMVQLSRYSRGVCGLAMEGYDLAAALEDLLAVAEYSEPDADPAVCQQATELLEALITVPEESE